LYMLRKQEGWGVDLGLRGLGWGDLSWGDLGWGDLYLRGGLGERLMVEGLNFAWLSEMLAARTASHSSSLAATGMFIGAS
jgi:hypothetical protein